MNFGIAFNTSQVIISPSGPGITGNSFTLRCSATLISPPLPLPSNVPPPSFEWFYGPHGNAALPPGVTSTATALMSGNIYTSTLLFFPTLTESHTGNYTCRLGAGRLVNSSVVSADGMNSIHMPESLYFIHVGSLWDRAMFLYIENKICPILCQICVKKC